MKAQCKRIIIHLLMLVFVSLYADSHLHHDIWMTHRISELQDQIDFLLKYVKILKRKINETPNRQYSACKNKR